MKNTFTAAALVSCASAFWGHGHLLVAREAESLLSRNASGALKKALDVLKPLSESKQYPDLIKHEKDHPFTECATFADDIKGEGMTWQASWHFINQPYFDQGGSAEDYPDFRPPSQKIDDALDALTRFLKGDSSAEETEFLKIIKENFSNVQDQKAFALRLVIHYIGDIHQPLHVVAEVDSNHPRGDKGGNDEKVPDTSGDGVDNLHAIWDSVIYDYPGYQKLPLSPDDWDQFTNMADSLEKVYPIDESKLKLGEFSEWATEGLALAKDYAYTGFTPESDQTKDYLDKARPVIKERMMYASHRLYATIVDIYGDSEIEEASEVFADLFTAFLQ